MVHSEYSEVTAFREWFKSNGGYIHPFLRFVPGESGMPIYTNEELPPESTVVSCPISLVITPNLAKQALTTLAEPSLRASQYLVNLSEVELICTYIIMHWVLEEEQEELNIQSVPAFKHLSYLRTFPLHDTLRTSLHFTGAELALLKGTELFGATEKCRAERQAEWLRCRQFVTNIRGYWLNRFTWPKRRQRYLSASSYLTSRAFPSTILSGQPTLVPTDSTTPVLIPGMDAFNHKRKHAVSWITDIESTFRVSLIIHKSTQADTEVFNNYGIKTNAQLIIGYGFVLPSNPDDTAPIKIGDSSGSGTTRWEIGREARGIEGLWEELKGLIVNISEEEERGPDWSIELEAAEALGDMVLAKLDKYPILPNERPGVIRKDVWDMISHYVDGQLDIMNSVKLFAASKRREAMDGAQA